jgi:long-chain acyl-CoA synthetase
LSDGVNAHLREAAQLLPKQVAIVDGDRELTWSEFDLAVEGVARRLISAGLLPGQRVALMGENTAEFLILCFGVWRAAGVMAIIFPSFGPFELDYAFTNAEPRFLFVEKERRAAAAAAVERTGVPVRFFNLEHGTELLGGNSTYAGALPYVDSPSLAIIAYTSGTSGTPKAVAHSHKTIAMGAEAYARIWRVTAADIFLVAMPLSWMAGLFTVSLTAIAKGARLHLLRRFKAEDALDAMVNRGVSFFFGATTMYVKIVNAYHQAGIQNGFQLRCCISGGEPRNEAIFDEWRRMTGAGVLDCYAATECWPIVTYDPGIDAVPHSGSAGKLVDGAQLRLRGPGGEVVAAGEVGEAEAFRPDMMLGYWKEPELTAKAMTADGWYRTGDYLRIDAEGYVYVIGRASDLIIRGGTNVSPAEVEQVLSELDSVSEVAVVGLPDAEYGQLVAAAVVVAPGVEIDEATMQAYCASRLARFKVPSMIRVVKDLPHNASGKVLRRAVIPILAQMRAPSES